MPNVYVLPDQRLVTCGADEAMLPAALRAGIPFAHACGGKGSCSTCRVVVIKGWESCAPRTSKELAIAERLCFGDEFRLACQTQVTGDVTIRRLVLDERDQEFADIRRRAPDRRRWSRPLTLLRGRRGSVAEPIGDEMPVAAMFADIRGFTAFAETVLPYDVIHVLQRRLRDITDAIERNGGVVTSYMGDGVMALFRPSGSPSPSHRAVGAGLEILAAADTGSAHLEELYGRSFDVNVGVHYGPAIVGSLFGNPPTVTAIGDTVNLAHRIEQANKEHGTRFLVSEPTAAELGDDVRLGRSYTCTLSGKAGEYRLVEVLGLAAP